jgi:hypothetical protein
MADSFLDWCKARETAAHSRFKRRGHKKKYAAEADRLSQDVEIPDLMKFWQSGLTGPTIFVKKG